MVKRNIFQRAKHSLKDRPGVLPWLLAAPQRSLFGLLGLLPERMVYGISKPIGRLALLAASRRKSACSNIELAFPEINSSERDCILTESAEHLGCSGADAMVLWPRRDLSTLNERVQFEEGTLELLEKYRGKSVLFIQTHLGAIEMTTTAIANLGFEPATVMRRPSNWYLAEDLLKARNRIKGEVLPREGALKRMLTRLNSGQSVVLTFDQNARKHPLFVPWFGKLAATERTPAALASKTGVPVMLSWCVRQTGPKPFRIGCKLVRSGEKERPDEARLIEITTGFHVAMEELIKTHPQQYLWLHNRYKTRPRKTKNE